MTNELPKTDFTEKVHSIIVELSQNLLDEDVTEAEALACSAEQLIEYIEYRYLQN